MSVDEINDKWILCGLIMGFLIGMGVAILAVSHMGNIEACEKTCTTQRVEGDYVYFTEWEECESYKERFCDEDDLANYILSVKALDKCVDYLIDCEMEDISNDR